MHGFTDVEQSVEDDGVASRLLLISENRGGKKKIMVQFYTFFCFVWFSKMKPWTCLMKTSMMDLQTSTLTLSF